jgi:hypothetical protein
MHMNKWSVSYVQDQKTMAHRLTADKREIRDFPKFAYGELLLSANRYTPCRALGDNNEKTI